jgi:hypothetical protein
MLRAVSSKTIISVWMYTKWRSAVIDPVAGDLDRLTTGSLATVNDIKSQAAASKDEAEIRTLIERWARAVREENRAAIHADHDASRCSIYRHRSYRGV